MDLGEYYEIYFLSVIKLIIVYTNIHTHRE